MSTLVLLGAPLGQVAAPALNDDEKGTDSTRTPGGEQQVSIINEPGLYSLLPALVGDLTRSHLKCDLCGAW